MAKETGKGNGKGKETEQADSEGDGGARKSQEEQGGMRERKKEPRDERCAEQCGTVRNSARNMTCVGSAHGGQVAKVNPDAGQNP